MSTLDARVDRLMAQLTPREMVGQLNQRLFGWRAVERRGGRWQVTDELRCEIDRWDGLGALYGLFRADAWSGRSWDNGIPPEERAEVAAVVGEAVRAASSHGISPLLVEEAPHGHQALGGGLLPTNLAVAATWHPELLEEAAAAVAAELAASGVHIALVSGLDILRDGRWGRSEECFGEDPELASQFTRALVTGMQGEGRARLAHGGVAVVLKHLAAQGEAMGGRNGQSAVLGHRDLREIHLPAVRTAISAGVVGLMAAYNDIDGVPCCANPALLNEFARAECGFDGIIMADGFAVDRLVSMTGSLEAAARTAVASGVDLSLWDESFATLVEVAEHDCAVASAVTRACRRVLRVKGLLGLLPGDPTATPASAGALAAAGARTAQASMRLARESLVLLVNRAAALPISVAHIGRVVVVGPNADRATALLGDYVPPLRQAESISVLAELRRRLPDALVEHCSAAPESAEFEIAVKAADVVVAVVGGTSHRSYDDHFAENGAITSPPVGLTANCGEGLDLADLTLPNGQDRMVERARDLTGSPVIAVVVAGRPHVLTEVIRHSDATLWAGYPGPYGSAAIVDALVGVYEPTGRMPMTLPRYSGVAPVHYNDRHAADGVYLDASDPVLFEFAHGGGYAQTDAAVVEDVRVDVGRDEVRLRAVIRAVHPRSAAGSAASVVAGAAPAIAAGPAADFIVPVFVHRTGGSTLPRLRELVGFRRVHLPDATPVPIEWVLPVARVFADPQSVTSRSRFWIGTRCVEGVTPLVHQRG